jgi:large subunit ribosomal protein L13
MSGYLDLGLLPAEHGTPNVVMKTYSPKRDELDHRWHLVDADGMVLGRLASNVAQLIRGKHKPTFAPHADGGDFVVVINAEKVRLTGRKLEQKLYFHHTGYMGHARFTPVAKMLAKHPERVIERAVYGMLPKTTLGRQVLRKRLKVYAGPAHPHQAQNPTAVELK